MRRQYCRSARVDGDLKYLKSDAAEVAQGTNFTRISNRITPASRKDHLRMVDMAAIGAWTSNGNGLRAYCREVGW